MPEKTDGANSKRWTEYLLLCLIGCVVLVACASERQVGSYETIDLSGTWKMIRDNRTLYADPALDDSHWAEIELPTSQLMAPTDHSPPSSISGTTDISDPSSSVHERNSGYIWFRKHVKLERVPTGDLVLQIREIMNADQVYVNGTWIGATGQFPPAFRSGWSQFRSYRLPSHLLRVGDNVVAIQMYYNAEAWITGPLEILPSSIGKLRQLWYDFFLLYLVEGIFVLLLVSFIFFLFFYLVRGKEREYLYFSLANGSLVLALTVHFFEDVFGALPVNSNTILFVSESGLMFFPPFISLFFIQYVSQHVKTRRLVLTLIPPVAATWCMMITADRYGILYWRGVFLTAFVVILLDLLANVIWQTWRGNRKGLIMLLGMLPVISLGVVDMLSFGLKWIDNHVAFYIYGFPVMLVFLSAHLVRRFIQSLNEAEQLNVMLQQYQTIFENATDGVFQTDEGGALLTGNSALAKILGYASPSEMHQDTSGMTMAVFLDDSTRKHLRELLLQQDLVRNYECMVTRKDKSITTISLNLNRVCDRQGQLIFYQGILEDITEKKMAEKLRIEKKAAERANQAKSEFLANISHELRTPLQGILGFAKLGLERADTMTREKVKFYFDQVNLSGERLLLVLNDLLDLSRLESGKVEYHFAVGSLTELVRMMAVEFESSLRDKRLTVDVHLSTVNDTLEMDREKILQLLRNIFSNAIKFSHDGGQVKWALAPINEHLLLSLYDTGVGIPHGELESVFDMFHQSNRTKDGSGGTGLGLSICKRIAEDHQGTIWAEHNPGGGTVIKLSLPFRQKALALSRQPH